MDSHIEIGSIYGMKTHQGLVELTLDGKKIQMDIRKAREVCEMLHEAIEAAISDGLLVHFLTTKAGLSELCAAAALADFREMRQGSKGTVYPTDRS